VPVTSFCKYERRGGKPVPTWFGLDESRPLFFFAGIWRPFFGERKQEGGEHLVFAFLTTAPSAVAEPVHEKAMPVILNSAEAREIWMQGSAKEALALQRPAPEDSLRVIASGQEWDGL
jgi:putative SOS response-associated peptidase YedK